MKCPLTDEWILEFFFNEGSKFDELENLRKFATATYRKALGDAEKAVSTLIIYPAGEAAKPHFVRVIRALTPETEQQ